MQGWKMQDLENAGLEIAGLKNAGLGKCGTLNTNRPNEFHIYACVTDTSSTCGSLVR